MLGWREKLWVVNFGLGKSNDDCGLGAAEKEISEEEGAFPLIPSSTSVVKYSVLVSVDVALVILTCAVLMGCGAAEAVQQLLECWLG